MYSDRIRMVFRYALEGDSVRDVCVQAEKHLTTFADVRAADYFFTHGSFEDEMAIRWYLASYKTELLLEPQLQTGHDHTRVLREKQRHRPAFDADDLRGTPQRSQRLLAEAHAIIRQLRVYEAAGASDRGARVISRRPRER